MATKAGVTQERPPTFPSGRHRALPLLIVYGVTVTLLMLSKPAGVRSGDAALAGIPNEQRLEVIAFVQELHAGRDLLLGDRRRQVRGGVHDRVTPGTR